MDTENKSWVAYRFELVFLNTYKNKWQFFQELPIKDKNNKSYPEDIYSLLNGFRRVFHGKINKSSVLGCAETRSETELQKDVSLPQETLNKIIRDIDFKDRTKIIQDIIDNYNTEGIDLAGELSDIFDNLKKESPLEYTNNIQIKVKEILKLMTCLYIDKEWDIFGMLDFSGHSGRNDPAIDAIIKELIDAPFFLYKMGIDESTNNDIKLRRIFISYSTDHENSLEIASTLCSTLENREHVRGAWFDRNNMHTQSTIPKQIEDAIDDSSLAVILFGGNKLSNWQNMEFKYISDGFKNNTHRAMPLIILFGEAPQIKDLASEMREFIAVDMHEEYNAVDFNAINFANKIIDVIKKKSKFEYNCENLLGYKVLLDIGRGTDIKSPQRYYAICHNIGGINSFEAQQYKFWGWLFDDLQRALPHPGKTSKEIYIAIYKIKACGWNHYLQIYFHPTRPSAPKGQSSEVFELLCAILGTRKGICSPKFNDEYLTFVSQVGEHLVQIRMTAFQEYVAKKISQSSLEFDSEEEMLYFIGNLFCEHAHNLAKIEAMHFGGNWFGYPHDTDGKSQSWERSTPKDKKDECKTDAKNYLKISIEKEYYIDVWISPLMNEIANKEKELFYHLYQSTTQKRLADQCEWLRLRVMEKLKYKPMILI